LPLLGIRIQFYSKKNQEKVILGEKEYSKRTRERSTYEIKNKIKIRERSTHRIRTREMSYLRNKKTAKVPEKGRPMK
jgi:hypothetical protein